MPVTIQHRRGFAIGLAVFCGAVLVLAAALAAFAFASGRAYLGWGPLLTAIAMCFTGASILPLLLTRVRVAPDGVTVVNGFTRQVLPPGAVRDVRIVPNPRRPKYGCVELVTDTGSVYLPNWSVRPGQADSLNPTLAALRQALLGRP